MPIAPDDKSYLFAGTFMLSNRMQTTGDSITGELSVKQWFLLLVIRDLPSGSNIVEIAADAGTTRQNVKKLLVQLAGKGYVELRKNPQDKRSLTVFITKKGTAYMKETALEGRQFINRIFTGVAQSDIESARRVVTAMIQNLEAIRSNQQGEIK